jgi:hypothetical protein
MQTHVETVILGGAGFVGQAIAAELVSRAGAASGAVRILTRSRARARSLWSLPGIEIVTLDPREEGLLCEAIAGQECDQSGWAAPQQAGSAVGPGL